MKKILILISLSLLFFGCTPVNSGSDDKIQKTTTQNVTVYCDKEKNVEYLFYYGYRELAISPRLTTNGKPSTCGETKWLYMIL